MNPSILRIVDANCNRAREALRVLEDYTRFTLNHAGLSEQLKALRHDFQRATDVLQARAIAFRDTQGDVGTHITTETEQKRASLSAVIIAASKRLSEALRTIEEYAKVGSLSAELTTPADAALVESIRYRFYDVEKQIVSTLSPGRERMKDVRLYVLVTESLCKLPWLDVVRQAIDGGADCIQLREKDLESGEILHRAKQMVALCSKANVISVINDRVDIAILSGADGVHVGQNDLHISQVRQLAAADLIVGVSTHQIDQAQKAVADGADYIGVGPIFRSTTKQKSHLSGLVYASEVACQIRIPTIAISGIGPHNLDSLLETGLRAVAVSSAVISSDDPRSAAQGLKTRLTGLGT